MYPFMNSRFKLSQFIIKNLKWCKHKYEIKLRTSNVGALECWQASYERAPQVDSIPFRISVTTWSAITACRIYSHENDDELEIQQYFL